MTANIDQAEFTHFLGKARDAARFGVDAWRPQSTGEKVSVALALNRADWLKDMGYTIAEAIDRAGPVWIELLPLVVRQLAKDGDLPE